MGASKLVVDSLVFKRGKGCPVSYFHFDFIVSRLENQFYVKPFVLLHLKIMLYVFQSVMLEGFKSFLVVGGIVYVQIFFFKVNALCVCLFSIVNKFLNAVGKVVVHLGLIKFFKKNLKYIINVQFHFVRQCVGRNSKRYSRLDCSADFRCINLNLI